MKSNNLFCRIIGASKAKFVNALFNVEIDLSYHENEFISFLKTVVNEIKRCIIVF